MCVGGRRAHKASIQRGGLQTKPGLGGCAILGLHLVSGQARVEEARLGVKRPRSEEPLVGQRRLR